MKKIIGEGGRRRQKIYHLQSRKTKRTQKKNSPSLPFARRIILTPIISRVPLVVTVSFPPILPHSSIQRRRGRRCNFRPGRKLPVCREGNPPQRRRYSDMLLVAASIISSIVIIRHGRVLRGLALGAGGGGGDGGGSSTSISGTLGCNDQVVKAPRREGVRA